MRIPSQSPSEGGRGADAVQKQRAEEDTEEQAVALFRFQTTTRSALAAFIYKSKIVIQVGG